MKKFKNFFRFLFVFFIFNFSFFVFDSLAYAVCPLCTIAVGSGVGLCRILGIDDTISGVWIGGLTVSLGLWISYWLKRKKIIFPFLDFLTVLILAFFTLTTLFLTKMIGISSNKLWGIDKLVLGIVFGMIGFVLAVLTDKFLRKINKGKPVIYYQKVIVPLLYLTLLSLIFYKLTC